ncbi:MAG: hypothetical protein EZS26_000200 [Candidatus Ordinivivax streblomastigis]|uniref:Uncharacterized protein n=1 Tax=Candidatus Ordinivivax streblomastigis TaxID=2540710 RepID=A0A5M8P552_9BACT|nr:MAG: hypothetical protein EZS26_000200 [Candidatus Ordinivivax streblomastigis]
MLFVGIVVCIQFVFLLGIIVFLVIFNQSFLNLQNVLHDLSIQHDEVKTHLSNLRKNIKEQAKVLLSLQEQVNGLVQPQSINVESEQAYISRSVGIIDETLQTAISQLTENTQHQLQELTKMIIEYQNTVHQYSEITGNPNHPPMLDFDSEPKIVEQKTQPVFHASMNSQQRTHIILPNYEHELEPPIRRKQIVAGLLALLFFVTLFMILLWIEN